MRPCPRPDARCHGWSIPCGWSHCLPEPECQTRMQMQKMSAQLQLQEPAPAAVQKQSPAAVQALVSEQV